jgi:truncated hemoglobin YjbI
MAEIAEADIYSIIGADGFQRLVAEFYRQVPADDLLGPMYPADDLEGAEYRLRGFLIGRFGGPQTYIEERGHPALRMLATAGLKSWIVPWTKSHSLRKSIRSCDRSLLRRQRF